MRGRLPTVFVSFGGLSEGGKAWDSIFATNSSAAAFGYNAARLAKFLSGYFQQEVFVGIDLDVEGTSTTLPAFPAFLSAFRAQAPFAAYPIMMCALSGLASPNSTDHYKASDRLPVSCDSNLCTRSHSHAGGLTQAIWPCPARHHLPKHDGQ